jgi:hypothetical protein
LGIFTDAVRRGGLDRLVLGLLLLRLSGQLAEDRPDQVVPGIPPAISIALGVAMGLVTHPEAIIG